MLKSCCKITTFDTAPNDCSTYLTQPYYTMASVNLLELYPAILVPILAEWSYDRDIGRLDSAVCSSNLRPLLMSIFTKCFLLHFTSQWEQEKRNEWVVIRGMGVRSLKPEAEILNDVEKLLLSKSMYLDVFCGSISSLTETVEICPIIRMIRLEGEATDSEVLSVIPRIQNLECWDIELCPILTVTSTLAIVESFPQLKALYAYHNISEAISLCKSLERVQTVCNSATYSAVAHSRSLTDICFWNDDYRDELEEKHQMTDADGANIVSSHPNLRTLKLYLNKLTDASIMLLGNCHQLTSLALSNAQVTDKGLQAITKGCPMLTDLKFSSPLVTDAGVISVAHGCPSIDSLSMSNCDGVGDSGIITVLQNMKKLFFLEVSSIKATDLAFMVAFQICPSLRRLNICERSFDEDDDESVAQMSSRAIVSNVRDADHLDLCSVLNWIQFQRKSEKFTIRSDVDLCSTSLQLILLQCPLLTKVHLREYNIDIACLEALSHCPLLRVATLSKVKCSYDAFYSFLCRCLLLEKLRFYSCGVWTDEDADNEKSYFKSSALKHLELKVHFLSDKHCLEVAKKCPHLEEIILEGCSNINNTSLDRFIRNCLKLSKIGLRNCRAVDHDQIRMTANELNRNIDVTVIGCFTDGSDGTKIIVYH